MDEIEELRRHARRNKPAAPPGLDVTANVMASLHRVRVNDWHDSAQRPMIAAAAASVLLAATIGLFAQQSLAEIQQPLDTLVSPFVVALE